MLFRTLILTIGLLLFVSSIYGQTTVLPKTSPATITVPQLVKLKTPDTEVGDAVLYLEKCNPQDRRYIKFFSTYAIQNPIERQNTILVTSFLCHSMLGAVNEQFTGGSFYPIAHLTLNDKKEVQFINDQQVPGSDTLWWIDIRNFNWTEQAWENVAKEDAYFVEPIVQHDRNGLLRLYAGNAVVRADWFNVYSSAITNQADNNSKTKIYKELLYGSLKAQPQTVAEFEKAWSIDTDRARKIGNASATLVTESKNVARNNRILFGYRTELGWYYRTYDVKNMRGLRDYAENMLNFRGNPPGTFDGGEIFATNPLHLQVYDLYDGKEKLIDFGDPTLVRHTSDVLADVRVRTPHSCYDCHAAGPIPSENSLSEFLKLRGEGKVYDYIDKLRIDRVVLNQEFENSIVDNQTIFARSLQRTNGLKPEENIKLYLNDVIAYSKPLDLQQCAYECGMNVETFKLAVTEKSKGDPDRIPMRLGMLLANDKRHVERGAWDSPGADGQPGVFQQTMIMINGLTKITDTIEPITNVIGPLPENTIITNNIPKLIAIKAGDIKVGRDTIGKFNIGDEFEPTGKDVNGYIGVKTIDGKTGYVLRDSLKTQ